jgi:hypothetical protein
VTDTGIVPGADVVQVSLLVVAPSLWTEGVPQLPVFQTQEYVPDPVPPLAVVEKVTDWPTSTPPEGGEAVGVVVESAGSTVRVKEVSRMLVSESSVCRNIG